MSELLTSKQIQSLLKLDRVTVYRMLNDGRLRGVKIGNQWRFTRGEIDRLLGETSEVEEAADRFSEVSDFPSDCVHKVQEIFAGILDVGAITVSKNGEPLTAPSYSNPFCRLMLTNPSGRYACQTSWKKIAMKTTGNSPMMVCHAGLSYTRATISSDGEQIGWLVAGQFYSKSNLPVEESKFTDLSEKTGISVSELKTAANKVPVLKQAQLDKVIEWTPKVAKTVQSILCERSDLLNRLQHIAEISTIHPRIPSSNS